MSHVIGLNTPRRRTGRPGIGSRPDPFQGRWGFTLVELLVVITIIALLLALLMPAMDQAIYQADLVRCGANQHGVGAGVLTYAFDHKRAYPYRPGAREDLGWHHYRISSDTQGHDDRPYLVGYVNLKLFLDPFLPSLNLDNSDLQVGVFSTINLYYGFQYARYNFGIQQSSDAGMFRVGDKLEHDWRDEGRLRRWGYLASDRDDIQSNTSNNWGSHPDADGLRSIRAVDDEMELGKQLTYARWQRIGGQGHYRGLVDLNFLRDDGAVERYNAVKHEDDERMDKAPITRNTSYYWPTPPSAPRAWIHLPKN
jgi:prepilin-type N-terminal cleavage/methylation domain-containing protein